MALSVMIVDDDERFLGLAQRILAGCRYRPDSAASSVSDALRQATRHLPDIALIDVGLPDGSGLELSRRLTDLPGAVRVVLISADSDATSYRSAVAAGALGFIPKSELSCAALTALLGDG
jgi:CheY-like chemotaxis protein